MRNVLNMLTPEPPQTGKPPKARWARVRVETDEAAYEGQLCVQEATGRVSDVLVDERPFLNLIEVRINGASPPEQFLAINKRYIRTFRILAEGGLSAMPASQW